MIVPPLGSTQLSMSATDKLVGRSTVGAGASEEIACTSAGRALLDDADAAAQRTTLLLDKRAIQISIGDADGSSYLSSGRKLLSPRIPRGYTVTAWYLQIDAGTITVDLYKRAWGDTLCSSSDTNVFATSPAVASGKSASSTGLSRSIVEGDQLAFYITTITDSTTKYVCLTLMVEPA